MATTTHHQEAKMPSQMMQIAVFDGEDPAEVFGEIEQQTGASIVPASQQSCPGGVDVVVSGTAEQLREVETVIG
jgi:malonyl CoA-acyl carrier protein transacylase